MSYIFIFKGGLKMPKSGLTAIKEIIANELNWFTWTEQKTPPPRTRNYSTFFTTQFDIHSVQLEWCSNGWGSGHVIIHLRDQNNETLGSYNLHVITDDTYKLTKEFLLAFTDLMANATYAGFDIIGLNKELDKLYQEKWMEALKKKR